MDCFIKKIFYGKIDGQTHRQFVRFSRGMFQNRAVAGLHITGSVKLKGSYEWANDFVLLASELGVSFSGIIFSKEEIDGMTGRVKRGLWEYNVSNLSGEKVKELWDNIYCMLLDGSGQGISLKMKKKLPKPGKSASAKVDDKFCQIECDLKFLDKIRGAFFWDVPNCKKASASHNYDIIDITIPKGEKDFEKIRLLSKRKGKLTRKLAVNGNETQKVIDFEA